MTRADLIARVEAASGGDRPCGLICDAWDSLCESDPAFKKFAVENAMRFSRFLEAGAYLDAAMMLVPKGAWFLIKNVMGPQPMTCDLFVADVLVSDGKDRPIRLTRPFATPALALVAACLRAGGE